MAKTTSSTRYSLNREDGYKILVGLLIACVGAALTYMTEVIPNIDLGGYTPVVVAGWSVIVNTIRKFLSQQ